ncbi:DUF4115 domain-containing protein [bacterium]|nr:DUF4115 domain-containing protein [bacterium]
MEESIGQKLRSARLEKELSLEQISKEMHIRVAYLIALEEDNYASIPSEVQAKGFYRSYAEYLHLPVNASFPNREPEKSVPASNKRQKSSAPSQDNLETTASIILFQEIGEELRNRREILGLSQEDIEDHTHIPAHYIEFIETGAFDNFPSPTQARGMLINYINFLNINPDRLMLKYADALQSELTMRQAVLENEAEKPKLLASLPKPKPIKLPQWMRMFLSPDLVLVSVLGITIVAMTIWGIGRVNRTRTELVPQPTAPSLAEALLPTSTDIPTPSATIQANNSGALLDVGTQLENTATPTLAIASTSSIQVFVVAQQRAFLQVTVDGELVYEGRTVPGDSLTFLGDESIELLTGNAAGLQVYYNNQDTGVLGISGEVVKVIYTLDGIIYPTAAPTATLEATEDITPTPSPTPGDNPELPPAENTPIP